MKCWVCKQEILDRSKHGLHKDCFAKWFGVDPVEDFQSLISLADTDAKDSDWGELISSFYHGKFRKYSAKLGEYEYILKVEQEDYPDLPATECLCNEIADLLAIPVPAYCQIFFEEKLQTFVTRNFMEDEPLGSNLVHIYRYLNSGKDYSCEKILKVIEKEVGRSKSIKDFLRVCLFDALIANNDRHGRNLALIVHTKGVKLSPFYDNPCYLATEIEALLAAHHEPKGAIKTSKEPNPGMKDYCEEWIRLGFRDDVEAFAKSIDIQSIEKLIQNSHIRISARKKAIKRLIKRRYEELIHAL